MAKEVRLAPPVHTIWKRNDLKPHRTRTKLHPKFEQKFWDVIGLYLHPPEKALVLCCDEKTQCQALERSQPGLPLGIGHIRTRIMTTSDTAPSPCLRLSTTWTAS